VKDHEDRIQRLYALAEKLGRLSGEAHNLLNDLTARMTARRATTRSTNPPELRRRSRTRKPGTAPRAIKDE
jgi:hypothetical protein